MFGKIKQFFGFVGIEVKLDIVPQLSRKSNQITGTIMIEAKATQHVHKVEARFYRETRITKSSGSNTTHETRRDNLGEWTMTDSFDINDGEVRDVPFTMYINSMGTDIFSAMEEQGGMLGKVGSVLGAINQASNEYTYYVSATVDIKDAAIDPNETKRIVLVD